MSSQPEYEEEDIQDLDEEEENYRWDSGSDNDFYELAWCGACGKEFEVGIDECPESCPLCGEQYD